MQYGKAYFSWIHILADWQCETYTKEFPWSTWLRPHFSFYTKFQFIYNVNYTFSINPAREKSYLNCQLACPKAASYCKCFNEIPPPSFLTPHPRHKASRRVTLGGRGSLRLLSWKGLGSSYIMQKKNTAATLQHQERKHRGKRKAPTSVTRREMSKCSGSGNFFHLIELQLEEYLAAHFSLILVLYIFCSALQRRANSTFQARLEAIIINNDDDN